MFNIEWKLVIRKIFADELKQYLFPIIVTFYNEFFFGMIGKRSIETISGSVCVHKLNTVENNQK